ncbi:MAG: methionyl-tRNA formyltransferase [Candidatus Tyloplasma litorale]|nr:MAG: methionyl-tRNA formyltransferase [Mycoplasmatales bacterium]
MINVAFLGTPKIGAAALKSLINSNRINVVVVVTNEDKAIGRKHSKLQETPVATLAIQNNIKVIKTNSINKDINKLKDFTFDYIVTCAFGQFLNDKVLALPKEKAINIHGSLLPEGRGGAPIHWAIIKGKEETGISMMEMVSKMDAGNYYDQFKIQINKNDNVDTLFEKMSNLIEEKAAIGLINIDNGLKSTKQDESKVEFWLNIKKEDAKINFNQNNISVRNQIRGLTSKPGAWTIIDNKIIKVHNSKLINRKTNKKPGTIIDVNDYGIIIATKEKCIAIFDITIEGSKRKIITSKDKEKFINSTIE